MNLAKRWFPVVKTDPKPLTSLRDEMDRLFDDWTLAKPFMSLDMREAGLFSPDIDVVENDKHLKVTVDLPGLEEKDVNIELAEDHLTLSGKKEEVKEENDESWFRRERRFGTFHRVIPLPWRVNAHKAKAVAHFKQGVLTVKVDKPAEAVASERKIPITN